MDERSSVEEAKMQEKIRNAVPDTITPDMTSDQIWAVIRKKVLETTNIKELNDFIETLTASNRYVAIRDFVGRKKGDMLRLYRYSDPEEYQRYQNLKQEAEESYKHDNTPARMIDVDRACTQIYGILVNMIKVLQDEINVMRKAINAVESETDIEPTDWDPQPKPMKQESTKEEVGDDNDAEEDVQGEPESI